MVWIVILPKPRQVVSHNVRPLLPLREVKPGALREMSLATMGNDFNQVFKATYSPFPFENIIYIPQFTTPQIVKLFQTVQQDRKIKLATGVAENIAYITNG